ncbi:hypothetical protein P175DRAFT_0535584 [Aspergillus ochraceoroseus IBT 24754]|uniref:Uncharacterized protein n=1 Tax=Aspergillus ochraceoroseus IBT 24754 TaxID=1392256 RepID=A0A2T5LNH7_9EURO|nr:uncharacterized protein P175DRAFT_0535584 [Aspergillus ochraceoroseus IBT 24754]PTU17841.1 hypothetical protein P175DRAFT_0535584 [Aspergillus ochraceoroseus IBT 24754]
MSHPLHDAIEPFASDTLREALHPDDWVGPVSEDINNFPTPDSPHGPVLHIHDTFPADHRSATEGYDDT